MTRCARSRPAPRSGRCWTTPARRMDRTRRQPPRPQPERSRRQAVSPRPHRLQCRAGSFRLRRRSHRTTRIARTNTRLCRHTTTMPRSCSMRSCPPSRACKRMLPLRVPCCPAIPRNPRCRTSTPAPKRRHSTRTTRVGMSRMRLSRRHSIPPSTLHRGKTSSARRLPLSMRHGNARLPLRRRSALNRSRPASLRWPSRPQQAIRLATSMRTKQQPPPASAPRSNRNPRSLPIPPYRQIRDTTRVTS